MEKKLAGIRIVNNKIIITLPPIIQDSMRCLKTTNTNDVTASYNVILLNNRNQQLYVDNLNDFREVLKQFYIYKKLCTVVQNAINNLKVKLVTDNNCTKIENNNAVNKITNTLLTTDEESTNLIDSKPKRISQDNIKDVYLETNEALINATDILKLPIADAKTSEHDPCSSHADESKKCATTRAEPCPASCSQGVHLEMLPAGKRLLRKKGCCAVQ